MEGDREQNDRRKRVKKYERKKEKAKRKKINQFLQWIKTGARGYKYHTFTQSSVHFNPTFTNTLFLIIKLGCGWEKEIRER